MGCCSSHLEGEKDGPFSDLTNDKRNSTRLIRDISPNTEVGEYLKKVPIFAHLSKSERDKLGGALETRTVDPGDFVFEEGDEADHFFIIRDGYANVMSPTGQVVCQLISGDYFGEQSILNEAKRNACVRAGREEPLVMWTLGRPSFVALFQKDRLNITFVERRRMAVTAESDGKSGGVGSTVRRFSQPLPKAAMSDAVREMLLKAIDTSMLFRDLDTEHRLAVASVMYPSSVAKGATIIREGEQGDCFYVVEAGGIDVYQADRDVVDAPAKRVDNKQPGECFGDLALMYDAPRNATCTAAVPSTVRVLERKLFNRIKREMGEAKLMQYANWLKQVELLAPLTVYERMRLAEGLEDITYEANTVLARQGDEGDAMYLLVTGEVVFSCFSQETGKEELIQGSNGVCKPGGYFGERALMNKAPRACSIITSQKSQLLRVDRAAFEQLLGPLNSILRAKEDTYSDTVSKVLIDWQPVDVQLQDLHQVGVLGKGSYGYVKLVQAPDGKQYALKAVSKQRVVDTQQKLHIFNEKNLLTQMDHPFLIKLYATYTDKDLLYFLLEPSLGGELFRVLRRQHAFPPHQTMFYAGCVILAFGYLHKKNMIYRDLKPENLLLDSEGYLKVTDFGFCKEVKHKTWTMCGTPEYMAPEIIQTKGHGKTVDWWCVGILIYEMLASHTPFVGGSDIMAMYDRILGGKVKYPPYLDADAKDIIGKLLHVRPTHRLGGGRSDCEAIKEHPWFTKAGFDWEGLMWKKLQAPMAISKQSMSSLSNFSQRIEPMQTIPYVDDGTNWDKDF